MSCPIHLMQIDSEVAAKSGATTKPPPTHGAEQWLSSCSKGGATAYCSVNNSLTKITKASQASPRRR